MSVSVLLVASPWRHPGEPGLGAVLLRGVLARAGLDASVLHATLLYPRTPLDRTFLDRYGGLLFAPWVAGGPSPAGARDAILDRYADDLSLQGLRGDRDDVRRAIPPSLAPALDEEIARAGVFVEQAVEHVLSRAPDVLGCSITFESQLPATLALIERVKARRPSLPVMLGGAACQAGQARGMIASFPFLDAVCYTEGESVIAPLARALAGECDLASVPGIVFRDGTGRIVETPAPPLLDTAGLDGLPPLRYDDFFAQLAASEWRDTPVRLPFETSRGCWWATKHLCTFCGLNGEGLAFRARSPERAFAEIRALYRDYPGAHYLVAADNIIAASYFGELLPRLAAMPREPGRPLRVFYETKSNLNPEQVALLAAAGVHSVQPGIESFSDETLRLMDKGCTGLGQVQFLKWATQAGVSTTYSLLLRNPGESLAGLREMLALIPSLHHLPPPDGLVLTEIERFSVYHRDPARFGLRALRPQPFYRVIFPQPGVSLDEIAYQFDYDHPIKHDAALREAYRALCGAVDEWRRAHRERLAYWRSRGEQVVIIDERAGAARPLRVLGGAQAELFRYLDRARPFMALRERFTDLDESLLRVLLEQWEHERIACATPSRDVASPDGKARRWLAVLPRVGPAPARNESPGAKSRTRLPIAKARVQEVAP